jgi:uncharacterized protein YajQ (UPF0234 family)
MPSFDIVSEIDLMEIDNAVNMTIKEIGQRFDFRGGKSTLELDKTARKIKIAADDDMKLRAIHQILETRLAKRNIDLRCLKYGAEEAASGNVIRQVVDLKNGLEKEEAKELTKAIKDSKLKVQAEIQGEQLRVSGKSIDDLQTAIAMIKGLQLKFPVQFINMRR